MPTPESIKAFFTKRGFLVESVEETPGGVHIIINRGDPLELLAIWDKTMETWGVTVELHELPAVPVVCIPTITSTVTKTRPWWKRLLRIK